MITTNNNETAAALPHIKTSIKTDNSVKVKEISDESLNGVIEIIKTQQNKYLNAGLTQVSRWL